MSISEEFVFHKVKCKICKHTWLYQGNRIPKCPLRRSKAHQVKRSIPKVKIIMVFRDAAGRRLTLDPKLLVNVSHLQRLHRWLGRVILWRKQQDLLEAGRG
jgi:hypothetical protein